MSCSAREGLSSLIDQCFVTHPGTARISSLTLSANSADYTFMILFSYFSLKQYFTFHANYLLETICMKYQTCCQGSIKNRTSICSQLIILPSVLLNVTNFEQLVCAVCILLIDINVHLGIFLNPFSPIDANGYICKQSRSRSDGSLRAVSSGSTLFAILLSIFD